MHEKEAVEMMRRCRAEIIEQRAVIDRLRPKAEAYDNMSALISVAVPRPSVGYGEDLAWILEKRIKEMEAAAKAAKPEGEE